MKRTKKSTPLLVASAGAATIVFGCRPKVPVPDRIGPPPTPPSVATPVPMRTPMRIGPPATSTPILPTATPDPPKTGTLELSAERPVRIWIRDTLYGVTPLMLTLPVGEYAVRVEDGGLIVLELQLEIVEGETVTRTIDLSRAKPVKTPIRIGARRE